MIRNLNINSRFHIMVATKLLAVIFLSQHLYAQETEAEDKTKFELYGYVSYEAIFDSHRSVFSRDAELYLFPAAPIYHEQTGGIINENPQLDMISLQSRLGTRIAGPDIFGAKLTALFEGDFLGTHENFKHMFRLRHALMRLHWERATITMGQFWHPMFTPEVFPKVVSFGAAVPFNPLNRSPQIRLDYLPVNSFKLTFAALAHSHFSSVGPHAAQRNSGLPDIQFQLHIGNSPNFTTGITAGYMWLKPLEHTLIQNTGNVIYRSEEIIGAYNLQWFGKVKISNLTLQAKISYGENMSQLVMIGGYGRILADTAKTYDYRYANINSFSSWVEAIYKINSNWEIGMFGGSIAALGANEEIDTQGPIWYNRAANMDRGFRYSPRVVYSHKKVMFALEYMYSTADYGDSFDKFGKPQNITSTLNHRLLFAARYSF